MKGGGGGRAAKDASHVEWQARRARPRLEYSSTEYQVATISSKILAENL